jgi:hypothetical protein
MKESSDTSFISRPKAMQAGRTERGPNSHLFLGHKLLGELRILMRLSSAAKSEHGNTPGSRDGESSY